MEVSQKIQKLIAQSLVLSDEKKRKLLRLLKNLNSQQQKELFAILQQELKGIKNILIKKLEQDDNGELQKKLRQSWRKNVREFDVFQEQYSSKIEKKNLLALEEEISTL